MKRNKHFVTGAYGYTGKYLARRLFSAGLEVGTLTNSPVKEGLFSRPIENFPLCFHDPEKLKASLIDCDVLYITYWVRFNHKHFTHRDAVNNTKILFKAAADAGVRKIVYVSITNADKTSDLEYFSGKGELEEYLQSLGISYSILRPAVIFGLEDILINNIIWMIRRFPFIAVFGDGKYKLQPIFVDDLAKLAIECGKTEESSIIDAIGPETFEYKDLLGLAAKSLGKKLRTLHVSPSIGYYCGKILSWVKKDVTITREEIKGLMDNTLFTESEPAAHTKLSEWMKSNIDMLGIDYHNELDRRK